jgi:radical SAM protein with 4Fe4S-binding SPASM domain
MSAMFGWLGRFRKPAPEAATQSNGMERATEQPLEFSIDPGFVTSSMPKILWIELTTKCPFNCVFCTRKTRFGAGRHLDFDLYQSMINELDAPEFIGLNYSGESLCYPQLLEAIKLANATGAATELVTAFATVSRPQLEQIVVSGLDRLAVSLHTMDPRQYEDIYGHSSLQILQQRIEDFIRIRDERKVDKPRLDFCFVAIHENLGQLAGVVRYAGRVGAAEVFVHPVIGRRPLPRDFSRELAGNRMQEPFKLALRDAVESARSSDPRIPITVLNPDVDPDPRLGRLPAYFSPPLPPGARIHTCDQSPFDSVHVLATGDVVVCEALDERPLGNLKSQRLRQIWHSDAYREFRRHYARAHIPECRDCVWKVAYQPGEWTSEIAATDGPSPQLLRGWYLGGNETVLWSRRESLLVLKAVEGGKRVRIAGILTQAPAVGINTLRVRCNKVPIGKIVNSSGSPLDFDRTFALPVRPTILHFEFRTDHTFRPALWGVNPDQRDLAFALQRIEVLK